MIMGFSEGANLPKIGQDGKPGLTLWQRIRSIIIAEPGSFVTSGIRRPGRLFKSGFPCDEMCAGYKARIAAGKENLQMVTL